MEFESDPKRTKICFLLPYEALDGIRHKTSISVCGVTFLQLNRAGVSKVFLELIFSWTVLGRTVLYSMGRRFSNLEFVHPDLAGESDQKIYLEKAIFDVLMFTLHCTA